MSEAADNPSTELADLLAAFLDEDMTPAQTKRLGEIVQSDPAARAQYLEHCRMHAALAWEHGVLGGMNFTEETASQSADTAKILTLSFRRKWARSLALAAALTLLAALLWQGLAPIARRSAWNSGEVVGTVSRMAGGRLSVPGTDVQLTSGDVLRVGEYELAAGLAQIVFENNVEVLIEAPARFSVESPRLLSLYEGRLSANVPPEGIGFTVMTPTAAVIDHGTEFGVVVSAEKTSEIHVFHGEVEVKPKHSALESLRLLTDQATRLDGVSGSPSGIVVAPERFLRRLDEPALTYYMKIRALKPDLFYRMAVSDDGVTLMDRSGNGHDGRIERGTMKRPPFSPGRHGSALRLRGPSSGAYAFVSDYPKATNNQLSVVAWVLADSRSRWASIAKNWAPGEVGQFHFGLFHDQGGLEVQLRQAGDTHTHVQVLDPEPLPLNEWQHVAFVADGAYLRLYRNGKEVGNAPYTELATSTVKELSIGAKLGGDRKGKERGPSGFWDGRIDEFAIFNHALDAKSIQSLFETEMPPGRMAKSR